MNIVVHRHRQAHIPQIDLDRASRNQLIAHIDELEFIIGDLLPGDAEVANARAALGLTETEARVLIPLMKGGVHSARQLRRASQKWGDADVTATINVMIHRLRKNLARRSIAIRTVFGEGYVIDPDDRRRLKAIIGEGA